MKVKFKPLIGIIVIISVLQIISAMIKVGTIGLLIGNALLVEPKIYDNIENYTEYMSFSYENEDTKWHKWEMDETIWPRTIQDASAVVDYKMIYYEPWDAEYLGYLVMDYSDEDYAAERARLKAYPSTNYIGYYSVTEEHTYELLAVYADEYNGFVYALTDGKNRIIYAEEIFCNYFMAIEYKDYIPEEYLLDGFDATENNPYERKNNGRGVF